MPLTLIQAEAQLAKYLAAEEAVLSGQSCRLNAGGTDRELTRADLAKIQLGIETWNRRCIQLGRSNGIMVRGVTLLP
jgi:hypothetical protein